MTTELFVPADPMTISGLGPYPIPHEYSGQDDIQPIVQTSSGAQIFLAASDFTLDPVSSEVDGDLYLTSDAAALYDGATIFPRRKTEVQQGWAGVAGPREIGLERELDRQARALQDLYDVATRTPAFLMPAGDVTLPPMQAGRGYVANEAANGFVLGPDQSEISAAEANAQAAAAAALNAQQSANDAANSWPRDIASASYWAGQPDGTMFMMAGAFLVRNASVPLSSSALADLGVAGFSFAHGSNISRAALGGAAGISLTVNSAVMRAAFEADATISVQSGDTAVLSCDPASGDDLQDMAYWQAGQTSPQGATVYLEVADGLQDVETILQITDSRAVRIQGTGPADFLGVLGATFANISGNVYEVTVAVDDVLPARVGPGYALGGQNIQGDGTPEPCNTGFLVDTVAVDRLSFTAKVQIFGVVPAAVTVVDATPSLGLTPNQLVIPRCTIRASEAGWDGALQDEEGFINCLAGGRVDLKDIGLSYNGLAGDNDMLFARDAGSEIYLRDNVVVAGTGAMVTRSYGDGQIMSYGSFLGGGEFGARVWQGSGGGKGNFTRTMMGSVSDEIISASSLAKAWVANSVLSGGNYGVRSSYKGANIEVASARIAHCVYGAGASRGTVYVDSNSTISRCTDPIILSSGIVAGDPVISANTNAAPEANATVAQGGAWQKDLVPVNGNLRYIGTFVAVLDFGAIAGGAHEDLTFAAASVLVDDYCFVQKSGGLWPAQSVFYEAGVSIDGVVSVRANNYSSASSNPVSQTMRVMVLRAQ